MKRGITFRSTAIGIAVFFMAISISSCKKGDHDALKVNLEHVYINVEDAKNRPPEGNATLLYDIDGHTPVLAPDGHQVTLGEYNMPSGYAKIKCTNMGTQVVAHMKGLIPNGVYTIWVLTFKSPGFDGTFGNLIGNGALGASDGSGNVFTASAAGTASLAVTMPAGSLSLFGSVGDCFSTEYEVHLVAAYHSDFMTHGSAPGPPTTWVVQFGFIFNGSDLGM